MKCVCGYEQLDDWELKNRLEEDPNFVNGDEEFKGSQLPVRIQMYTAGYRGYTGIEDKTLYACPKCGTVKITL